MAAARNCPNRVITNLRLPLCRVMASYKRSGIVRPEPAHAFRPSSPSWHRAAVPPSDITAILDLAEKYVELNRQSAKHADVLSGLTQINMFFENSTRTQASFELAGKRLGADVMNMAMQASSIKKGETLIDTAMTLNAMHPDLLVVRHPHSGAVDLLAQKVNCAVLNAGDGRHEHPTQALAGRADHPPRQGPSAPSEHRDLRRCCPFPRGALEPDPAGQDGKPHPPDRPADAGARPVSPNSAPRFMTT